MSEADLVYGVDDGVATISLNRPEKLNALTPVMLGQLLLRLRDAAADEAVRVIVLTGSGRGFCAGLDLGVIGTGKSSTGLPEPLEGPQPNWGEEIGPSLRRFYAAGWQDFILTRKPTIAAINGPAFGWGLILALHCDIRFVARSATLNATFARLGVPAEKNAAWLLTRLIGPAKAADLLYSARRFDGEEAERLGVVNAAIDDAALLAHVRDYAQNIATYNAPRALAAMKAQIWTAIDDPYNVSFQASDREQELATRTTDFREAFASYTQKRRPDYTGS